MRDLLLMVIVAFLCLAGLFSARYALMSYLWFSLFRPDIISFSPARPYSAALALVAVVSALRELPYLSLLFRNPWVWLFLLYFFWSSLSVLFAQNISLCIPQFTLFVTFSIVALLIPLVIRTRSHLFLLLSVIGGSLGLLGSKMGLFGIIVGGVRFAQGYGGMLSDNNLVALALVTVVPLLWRSMLSFQVAFMRPVFGVFLFGTTAAIVMCHSRGGILSLCVVVFLLAWNSKTKIIAVVFATLLIIPAAWLVRGTITDRMSTMSDLESDGSAMGRIRLWKIAVAVGMAHPVFGVGFGGENYRAASVDYISDDMLGRTWYVHNTYLQIFADSGFPALLLYCSLLWGQILCLRHYAKKNKHLDPEMSAWASALWIALTGYSVGSIFLSRVYFDLPYFLMLSVAALWPLRFEVLPTTTLVAEQGNSTIPNSSERTLAPDSPSTGNHEPKWRRQGIGRRIRSRRSI